MVETTAAAAGLAGKLAAALAPPAAAVPIPHTRIRALKAYRIVFRGGPHGAEEYSGPPGTINDIPTALLGQLKGRVEPAPPGSEIHGVPLEDWMRTDD